MPEGSIDPGPSVNVVDFSGTFEVKCSSKDIRVAPYGSEEITRSVSKGDRVTVVGYTYNSYGNLWYKTDKGDYIFFDYLSAKTYDQLPPSNYSCPVASDFASSTATQWLPPLTLTVMCNPFRIQAII